MLKPIAIDLGKTYWVIARTDDNNQPTVAGLGEGGLIPALLSEFQGQLVVGEPIEQGESAPVLRDCYHWVTGHPASRHELGQHIRDGLQGDVEIFLAGQWWSTRSLMARMFGDVTKVVKDYLAPQSSLPVVVAVPPSVELDTLHLFREALHDAGLALSGWCPTPLALTYGDADSLQRDHIIVATLLVDWGFLTFGVVEVRDGFPQLRVAQNLEWPVATWGQQLPLDQIDDMVSRLLLMAQEYWGIETSAIDRLLIGGEEAWIHALYPVLEPKISAPFIPFHQPRLAVAMGTSLFADLLQEGLLLAPVSSPTGSTQISLTGFALPEAQIEVRGGAQDSFFSVGLTGVVEHIVTLIPDQMNQLSVSVRAPDGRHFAMFLPVEHRSDLLASPHQSAELHSYAPNIATGAPELPTVPSQLPTMSKSVPELPTVPSHTAKAEASAKTPGISVHPKSEAEEVGESTQEELKIPDKSADAPLSAKASAASAKSSPSSSFARIPVVAQEEEDAEQIFTSIGEGDGETRILTQDSYAHLVGSASRKTSPPAVSELASPHNDREGAEEVEVSIEDHDIMEVVEDRSSNADVSLSQEELDEAEIDEVIDVLQSEKEKVGTEHKPLESAAAVAAALLARSKTVHLADAAKKEESASVLGNKMVKAERNPSSPSNPALALRDSLPKQEKAFGSTGEDPSSHSPNPKQSGQISPNSQTLLPNSNGSVVQPLSLSTEDESIVKRSDLTRFPPKEIAIPPLQKTASDVSALTPEQLLQKVMQARQMAREARSLLEESRHLLGELESWIGPQMYAMLGVEEDAANDDDLLDLSVRREARKILELGKQLAEVEANRLPTSNRKALLRLTKELDAEMQQEEGRLPIRLILQLANRLFETIRRDLRPW